MRTHSPPASRANEQIYNRLRAVMDHSRRYAFRGQSRLASDAGVARSAISRLLSGKRPPPFWLVLTVVELLERDLKRPLPLGELFSFDNRFPTPVCALCGCPGCLPSEAYDAHNQLRPEYRTVRPGRWITFLTASVARTRFSRTPPTPDETS